MWILRDRRAQALHRQCGNHGRQVDPQERLTRDTDNHEWHIRLLAYRGIDRLGTDLQGDCLDETPAVGFEDLVYRSQRYLMNSTCIAVAAGFLRQRGRGDLIRRLRVLVRPNLGNLVRSRYENA